MRTKFKSFLNERLSNYNVAKKIAFELGEEINELLGEGSYGKAYSTKSGKVLKLTYGITEVNRAYVLSRNKNRTKYLINYYNVGKIVYDWSDEFDKINTGKDDYEKFEWYILMDQVLPLTNNESEALSNYMIYEFMMNIIHDKKINNFLNEYINYIKMYSKNETYIKNMTTTMIELYPHIINIAKELKKHHIISNFDFHAGNLGWNKDRTHLVFFDIGGNTKKDNYKRNNKKIIIDENEI
jgi:hypothetical protein